jgi:pimeloyl-ACP methyl ester carboxylesterase
MEYEKSHYVVSGIDTAVFTAGAGAPLVFLHGGGTATGFDALLPLAERCRLIVPIHPGFGSSADDPEIDDIHDYVLHYLDLLDELELGTVALAGHSLGGFLAAWFAIQHPTRVSRLVLASPFGLDVPGHETVSLAAISPEDVAGYLTDKPEVFAGLPDPPTSEFLDERAREARSAQRVLHGRTYDAKLVRRLHRLTMPTLVLWGEGDRLIPAGQASTWAQHIPHSETLILPGVTHLLFDESRAAVDALGDFAVRP